MNLRRPITVLATVAALVALFAVGWGAVALVHRGSGDLPTADAAPLATRAPVPAAPASEPEPDLASLGALKPRSGVAVQAAGPFDDRFTMSGIRFDGKAVHAAVDVTSDVSEILEFEAVAGFYDAKGTLVGTNRYIFHLDEEHATAPTGHGGTPDELKRFTIAVPTALRGTAVSAAVGVPVLVNE